MPNFTTINIVNHSIDLLSSIRNPDGLLQTKSGKTLAANPKNKFFCILFIFMDMFQDNSFKHLVGLLQPEWEFLCKNPIWCAICNV